MGDTYKAIGYASTATIFGGYALRIAQDFGEKIAPYLEQYGIMANNYFGQAAIGTPVAAASVALLAFVVNGVYGDNNTISRYLRSGADKDYSNWKLTNSASPLVAGFAAYSTYNGATDPEATIQIATNTKDLVESFTSTSAIFLTPAFIGDHVRQYLHGKKLEQAEADRDNNQKSSDPKAPEHKL